ncbi:SDR family NAD(P)-dependent oxidoreductase [Saccharothrix syringae]|uniref:SDR family NAD(P)-dependent oxidoreductase n=1 Tax=Saccharothrix syringae TaxID=103733 RepID=A0A5Q0GVH1_SACSY|nr:SDR family NAD(P)-dependent oxidoreductase [Saccharothrix syringae]QFZ17893.1 SDR family NAD(P)-dependent oxidoreductase [Saccharothrix syringae]
MTRTVLVTGGSDGIGRATAARFAAAGDRVWFTYRTGQERAEKLVAELSAAGADVAAFPFDQGNWSSHQRLFADLPGPVDVLVNNAAVGSRTVEWHVEGGEVERAEAFLRINSVGPLWLVQQVLPDMLERGGVVVNVASVGGGVSVFPGFHVADGMSKAALAYLTRHLAAELAHERVRVVAVCPGAVDTTMFRASTLSHLDDDARASLVGGLPGGRLIEAEEVAELVHWLTLPGAALLHGAVIDASMGLGVHPGLVAKRPVERSVV